MKKIILILTILLGTTSVYATTPMQGKYNWSLGFDAMWNAASPSGPDWSRVLDTGKTGFAIYLADRFTDIWGFEFGYSWRDRNPENFTTTPGQTYFGTVSTAQVTYTAKIRIAQTYLDFYAHIPLTKYVEGMAGLGAGWARTGYYFMQSQSGDPVFATLQGIEGRTSIIARFNIGIQALWTERVGARLLFSYQTTSMLKARGLGSSVSSHPINNTYAAVVGIYWNFMGHD